jgi:hypothetical protein
MPIGVALHRVLERQSRSRAHLLVERSTVARLHEQLNDDSAKDWEKAHITVIPHLNDRFV